MKKKFVPIAAIIVVLILLLEMNAKSNVVGFVKKNYLDGISNNIKLNVKSNFKILGPNFIFNVEYKRDDDVIEVFEVNTNILGKVKDAKRLEKLSDEGFKKVVNEIKLKELSATCEKDPNKDDWYELVYKVKMDMPEAYVHYIDSGDTRFNNLSYYISFSPEKDNNYMFGELYPSFQLIDYDNWTDRKDRDSKEFVTEARIGGNFIHEDNKHLFIDKVKDAIIQINFDKKVIKKIVYKAN